MNIAMRWFQFSYVAGIGCLFSAVLLAHSRGMKTGQGREEARSMVAILMVSAQAKVANSPDRCSWPLATTVPGFVVRKQIKNVGFFLSRLLPNLHVQYTVYPLIQFSTKSHVQSMRSSQSTAYITNSLGNKKSGHLLQILIWKKTWKSYCWLESPTYNNMRLIANRN